MIHVQNFKEDRFGHSVLVIGIYFELGIWNLGFEMVD